MISKVSVTRRVRQVCCAPIRLVHGRSLHCSDTRKETPCTSPLTYPRKAFGSLTFVPTDSCAMHCRYDDRSTVGLRQKGNS